MQGLKDRLVKVEELLEDVLRVLKVREKRSEYQQKYYEERKAKQLAQRSGLKNPSRNNLNLKMGWDRRLQPQLKEWALIAYRFADAKKGPFAFMEWLSYTWNCCTYWHKVLTKSGGYNHLFIGFSGSKPLRAKWTDNDLFGCVKRTTGFTRVQRDQFGDALWWNWGYGVLGKVLQEMQGYELRWKTLPDHFTRPMLLMMGAYGMVEVRQGLLFDPGEHDCKKMAKAYAYAKPDLDRGWAACKRGLFSQEEPPVPPESCSE